VKAWLARHPRWTFHFTPTSGSWLNAVETFFSALTRQRIRRGSFHSIVSLQAAINQYLDQRNAEPRPFVWTASAASQPQASDGEAQHETLCWFGRLDQRDIDLHSGRDG
jgi:hypothetical protein